MAINFKIVVSLVTVSFILKKKSSEFAMHKTYTQPRPHSLVNQKADIVLITVLVASEGDTEGFTQYKASF